MRNELAVLLTVVALHAGRTVLADEAAGVPAPQSVAPLEPAAYNSLIRDNLDLRAENARLGGEAERLRRDNTGLALQVRDLERQQEDLAVAVRQLKVPEETTRQLEQLRADRAFLVAEVARLYLQVTQLQHVGTSAPPVVARSPQPGSDLFRQLEKDNQDLRAEASRLRQQVQTGSASQVVGDRRGQELTQALDAERKKSAALQAELQKRLGYADRDKKALRKLAERVFDCESGVGRLQEQLAAVRKAPSGASRKPGEGVAAGPRPAAAPDVLAEGRKLVEARRYADAERLYLAHLKGAREDAPVHYNLGVLYEDYLKDPAKAAQHYRKYLELNPKAPDRDLVRSWLVELDLQSR